MNFGYGRFACPGRFFASMQSKLILIDVIRKYDLSLMEEEGGRRPANMKFADANVPDPAVKILLRARRDV